MLMAPDGWRELYDNTLREVRAGLIPQGRIDDAVRRILRVKVAAHVLDEPRPAARPDAGRFERLGSAAHRALAREAVRESLVLLKNDHGLLPLDPHAHVLVAGPGADDIAMQSGGWTIDWQGDHNTNADFPGGTSIYAGIEAAVAGAGGSAELSVDGRYARRPGSAQRPDVAIVVYGEHPYAEFEGDRETLEYSPGDAADLKLLRRLKADGIPVVSVFLSGRPLWVNPELNASDAFVAAWLPGSEGAGIADVLFKGGAAAGHDFTGRLSFSWPATGLPVTFAADDRVHGALFANGYGLDYAGTAGAAGRAAIARHYSEDPAVPAALRAPAGSLFYAGHVTAPWSLFVADGGAEVHVTTHAQQSPHGALRVELGPAGAAATWDGSRDARLRITGRALDLSTAGLGTAGQGTAGQGAAGTLEVKVRVDRRPAARVALGVEGAWVDVTSSLRAVGVGAWQTLRIPVACLAAGGANLSQVQAPLEIDTAGALSLTLGAARLTPAASGAAGPGAAACPPTVGPLVSIP
jgi:beta-glucosidase